MNKHGAQNTGKTIKRILSYMKKYKFRFIFVLICILLSAVANVAGSMFIGTLIDDYITPLLGSTNPVFTGLLKAIWVLCMQWEYLLHCFITELWYQSHRVC